MACRLPSCHSQPPPPAPPAWRDAPPPPARSVPWRALRSWRAPAQAWPDDPTARQFLRDRHAIDHFGLVRGVCPHHQGGRLGVQCRRSTWHAHRTARWSAGIGEDFCAVQRHRAELQHRQVERQFQNVHELSLRRPSMQREELPAMATGLERITGKCCEPTSEERSAGNLHAAFWGSRGWVTASGDPVWGWQHPHLSEFASAQPLEEGGEGGCVGESGMRREEPEFAGRVRRHQLLEHPTPEQPRQHLHVHEEFFPARDPARSVFRETPTRERFTRDSVVAMDDPRSIRRREVTCRTRAACSSTAGGTPKSSSRAWDRSGCDRQAGGRGADRDDLAKSARDAGASRRDAHWRTRRRPLNWPCAVEWPEARAPSLLAPKTGLALSLQTSVRT